ncbi:MAG: dienelactone hydrolase family protein [Ignavibacteriaceae bacterium]
MKAENYVVEEEIVRLSIDDNFIEGYLRIPSDARSVIVFSHGSRSSRHSTRNKFAAELFNEKSFATLVFDLLTQEEERLDLVAKHLRFNISFLADRLVLITDLLKQNERTRNFDIGYFGSSTGAAAALVAAANRPDIVHAVVSKGGRPDLADEYLNKVKPPVLLVAGGEDTPLIRMNKNAMIKIKAECELEIIPGATRFFEEPGALQQVAFLARNWFRQHLK